MHADPASKPAPESASKPTPESFVTVPRPPIATAFDSLGALTRRDYPSPQMWLDVLTEMQRASARWYARRQEAIREAGALMTAPPGRTPSEAAEAWSKFTAASTQRMIEDVSDQMQTSIKAAMYLAPGVQRTAETLSSLRANGSVPH